MEKILKALIFDLLYNPYYGIIVYVRIFEGELVKGQAIRFASNQNYFRVERVGAKVPQEILKERLIAGEIGWFTANIWNARQVKVGDTVLDLNNHNPPLPGYQEIKPNVYSNLYPLDSSQYKEFHKALEELQIQDSSLSLESVDSLLLGSGFRCGFLGLLHQEIIEARLQKEYNCEIITTPPSVTYRIIFANGEVLEINSPQQITANKKIKLIEELFIELTITTPKDYLGDINQLCQEKRGIFQFQEWKSGSLYQLGYQLPFAEFIDDFHDKIKTISHGYASFTYRVIDFYPSDIVKVDILLNNQLIPDLSFLIYRHSAYSKAKSICQRLKETLNRESFMVPIQACIGKQVIARETLSALKKNVTSRIHGPGSLDRKMKLWAKQKKGKARMKNLGRINLDAKSLKEFLKVK
ncbi:MAG: GTP-binding protein LepA [Mycoplasmataceae bacterium RC_NB112A]|nr:MAG: GTP-binding protein LepA [Mycoplasmataceae bacterium RC_NB112A]KLL01868.1 MAG: GTP-binding protein LepA [Mycoplasmataceae bacterium RC_NB112A]